MKLKSFQCAISVMMHVSIYRWNYLASNQHFCLQFCYVWSMQNPKKEQVLFTNILQAIEGENKTLFYFLNQFNKNVLSFSLLFIWICFLRSTLFVYSFNIFCTFNPHNFCVPLDFFENNCASYFIEWIYYIYRMSSSSSFQLLSFSQRISVG